MPTDRLAQLYDQGPFPAAAVPQFPPELTAQVERLTGRRFDARLFQTYERVRAWLDYQGVALTPDMRAEQVLPDEPAAPAPTVRSPQPPTLKLPKSIDPGDLGD